MRIDTDAALRDHARLLTSSFHHWTGRDLIAGGLTGDVLVQGLNEARFALVSHAMEADPIFNYANATSLALFEMTWDEFTQLPSRMSAEPVHQDERQRLMDEVTRYGFIADYRGVRISKSGRRFFIEQATVWNLIDDAGTLHGQAAMFADWRYLEDSREGMERNS